VKGLENKTYGKLLRDLGFLARRRLRGDLIAGCSDLPGGCSEVGVSSPK